MKILVGYKGINVGKDLLDLAAAHAAAFKADVLVVTSMRDAGEEDQRRINEAESNLDQAKSYLEEKGVSCQTHLLIRGFEAGEDILAFATEKDVDEIIIGVKSRSKVGKLLFGSPPRPSFSRRAARLFRLNRDGRQAKTAYGTQT